MADIEPSVPLLNEDIAALNRVVEGVAAQRRTLMAAVDDLRRRLRDFTPGRHTYAGFIREYRYTAGAAGEMPTHRFYVECDGGVWLYAQVPSASFEQLMQDESGDGNGSDLITAERLNGRMILCRGDGDANAIVPLRFVKPIPEFDRVGNRLFFDAPVIYTGTDTPLRATIKGRSGGELVLVTEGDGEEFSAPPTSFYRVF